jgi:hypothetical protein
LAHTETPKTMSVSGHVQICVRQPVLDPALGAPFWAPARAPCCKKPGGIYPSASQPFPIPFVPTSLSLSLSHDPVGDSSPPSTNFTPATNLRPTYLLPPTPLSPSHLLPLHIFGRGICYRRRRLWHASCPPRIDTA